MPIATRRASDGSEDIPVSSIRNAPAMGCSIKPEKRLWSLASRMGVEPRLVRVAAVKGKRPRVIQRNLAAWIAL
jgi:hypothetical protein